MQCLNEWTTRNLYQLHVARISIDVNQLYFPFKNFANLRSLDVSYSEFNEDGLYNCSQVSLRLRIDRPKSGTSILPLSFKFVSESSRSIEQMMQCGANKPLSSASG